MSLKPEDDTQSTESLDQHRTRRIQKFRKLRRSLSILLRYGPSFGYNSSRIFASVFRSVARLQLVHMPFCLTFDLSNSLACSSILLTSDFLRNNLLSNCIFNRLIRWLRKYPKSMVTSEDHVVPNRCCIIQSSFAVTPIEIETNHNSYN